MKRIIRKGVYETNSSSSHALSIGGRKQRRLDIFPRNSEYIYHLAEYGVTYSDEWKLDVAKLYSEVDKARFMINIIVSHIEDSEQYPEVNYWLDWPNRIENPNRTFETLIKQKPFIWLKEVLEKETGTEFEFEEPERENYFPYYSHFYLDDDNIAEATGIDFFDETKFKERVRDIIFNSEIIITDADIPYCCDVDIDDL